MELLITDLLNWKNYLYSLLKKAKVRNLWNYSLLITDLLNLRKIGKITHTHTKLRNTNYQNTAVAPSSGD